MFCSSLSRSLVALFSPIQMCSLLSSIFCSISVSFLFFFLLLHLAFFGFYSLLISFFYCYVATCRSCFSFCCCFLCYSFAISIAKGDGWGMDMESKMGQNERNNWRMRNMVKRNRERESSSTQFKTAVWAKVSEIAPMKSGLSKRWNNFLLRYICLWALSLRLSRALFDGYASSKSAIIAMMPSCLGQSNENRPLWTEHSCWQCFWRRRHRRHRKYVSC